LKLSDWARKLSRRGFLAGGAATVAAIAAKPLLAVPAPADTEAAADRLPATLVRFTRDLFPHDRLPDSAYEKAIAPLLEEAAREPSTKKLLIEGIAQLNTMTAASGGKNYVDVSDERVRLAAIKQIESGAFFAKVYGDTITPLYNQPGMWAKFGYQGPSSALGGYLHRGFNDLDWL
jgi:hypothetical protein